MLFDVQTHPTHPTSSPVVETLTFKTGKAYDFDVGGKTITLSREPDEAFLDIMDAVATAANTLASVKPGSEVLRLDWSSVSAESVKREFFSLLGKTCFSCKAWDTYVPEPVALCVLDLPSRRKFWEDVLLRCKCADYARYLSSAPSNIMTPDRFCQDVREFLTDDNDASQLTVEVLDENRIAELGMNCLLGVAKGSGNAPRLLVIRAKASPAAVATRRMKARADRSIATSSAPVCIVGKGVTFDTGGINLKSTKNMESMHLDKTGAAVVVAIVLYIVLSNRKRPCDLVAVVPLVENMPDGNAIKPRDVLRSYSGKTVEIDNTDAEGRLILADAMAYASQRFRPKYILDFATLTGWSSMLFCDSSFVYFCASDELSARVEASCASAGERCVRMPRWTNYARYTTSAIADVKNASFKCSGSGSGASAGSGYMAAMFLTNFLPKRIVEERWVHVDITHAVSQTGKSLINANSVDTGFDLVWALM